MSESILLFLLLRDFSEGGGDKVVLASEMSLLIDYIVWLLLFLHKTTNHKLAGMESCRAQLMITRHPMSDIGSAPDENDFWFQSHYDSNWSTDLILGGSFSHPFNSISNWSTFFFYLILRDILQLRANPLRK